LCSLVEVWPFLPTTLFVLDPPGHVWHAPSFLLAPGPCLTPTLFPPGPAKVSTLADWFLYLKPFPRARLTHCPDDGGSKNLWNVGKLLPDYMVLQPRRQPYSLLHLQEPSTGPYPVSDESSSHHCTLFEQEIRIQTFLTVLGA
jgi:hypothetical protein